MEECKCGRIPPCYSGKKFRIHEELEKIKAGDEINDMVYELNKQMCDIGRLISVEEMAERYNKQILQSRLDGLSAWLKLQDMEEKKTKKMTKAEAFEYLKSKKVYVAGKSGQIQEVLFKAGFSWDKSSAPQKIASTDEPFLYMGNEGSLMFGSNMDFFIRDTDEEISADDILSIEIVEEYELKFSYEKAIELAKPLMHYLLETGHTEVISVCQEGISAIPIDSRELALGNWVYDGDRTQFPMYVIGLDINDVYLNFESNEGDVWESSYEDLCGIPLTEELMNNNGFHYNGVWWHKHEAGYALDVSVGLAYVQIEKWANGRIHSRCTCHGVRFVHELQNLFWNVTKQQLKVNL